jgi:hypothetical protein
VLGNYVTLGDRDYLATHGAGTSLHFNLPFGISADPGFEYRDRVFRNSKDYPNATGQTGHQFIGFMTASGPLPFLSGLTWQGRIALTKDTASYQPYAYNDFLIDFSLPYAFTAPAFAQARRNWTFAPFIGYSYTPYREPDPIVNPTVTRLDRQWRVGTTLDMSFFENVGFAMQAQYLHTQSTLSNFRTHDFIVSGGPTMRF